MEGVGQGESRSSGKEVEAITENIKVKCEKRSKSVKARKFQRSHMEARESL
jgi:hypothetical protein